MYRSSEFGIKNKQKINKTIISVCGVVLNTRHIIHPLNKGLIQNKRVSMEILYKTYEKIMVEGPHNKVTYYCIRNFSD